MVLQFRYEEESEIPDAYKELFSERDGGAWECTGIAGVRGTAEFDRLRTAKQHAADNERAAREELQRWKDFGEYDDIAKMIDEVPQLRQAAAGALEQAQIDEIVNQRTEATIKSRLSPVERELAQVKRQLMEAEQSNKKLVGESNDRRISDVLRAEAEKRHLNAGGVRDMLVHARMAFEVTDDGEVLTHGRNGVDQGMAPGNWLDGMLDESPHWLPRSRGSGSSGSGRRTSVPQGSDNPWTQGAWNMTAQVAYQREHGEEKAKAACQAAGAKWGAFAFEPVAAG